MYKYYFLFGNTPELSFLELSSLAPEAELVLPILASLSFVSDDEADQLFNRTGGSVKAIREIDVLDKGDDIAGKICEFLAGLEVEGKLTFSLGIIEEETEFSVNVSETEIKKRLKKDYKISSRFIEHHKTGLSASVLLHQAVKEMVVINLGEKIIFGQTALIQDIDDWTKRDRSKPYADRKKGMLPPKVARMMVNIASGDAGVTRKTVYDPFCGTGTVLAEALVVGHNAVGSDIDGKATAGAEKNLKWLQENYNFTGTFKIFLADASQVAKMSDLKKNPVDAIVTEPFLGRPKPELKQLDNIFKGLEKLYLGVFKAWTEILKPGARVVIVFPQVETHKKAYNLDKLIDKLGQLGYTTTSQPVVYARPGAIVARQIYTFEFKK